MPTHHDFDSFPHAGREWSGWIEYDCTAPSYQTEAATQETPPEFSDAEFELLDWGEIEAWTNAHDSMQSQVTLHYATVAEARAVAEAVFEDLRDRDKLENEA